MNEEFSLNSNQIVTPISESVRIQYVQIRVYRTRQTYEMERYANENAHACSAHHAVTRLSILQNARSGGGAGRDAGGRGRG